MDREKKTCKEFLELFDNLDDDMDTMINEENTYRIFGRKKLMNKLLLLLFALSLPIWCAKKEIPILTPITNEFITIEEFKAAKIIWETNHPNNKINISAIFSVAMKAREEKK